MTTVEEDAVEFKERIKKLDWYDLKELLKLTEENQDYEICIVIQAEIDSRKVQYVKDA